MIKNKKWIINNPNPSDVSDFSAKYQVSEILSKVLLNRNIENIPEFLNEDTFCFYDPFLLTDMAKAVDRIKSAIINK